jgi:hypothetical protein
MKFSPKEIFSDNANLLDHMHELVPKNSGIIGLITIQNGINTTLNEFLGNCLSLAKSIHEQTLLIGLHNRSEGFVQDVVRTTQDELIKRTLTQQAKNTGQFLGIISDSLTNLQSKSFWLHVPHSEAGVLFNLGYTMLNPTQKSLLQNQLIVFAVAPAEPISWRDCYEATNIYSDKDGITGRYGKKYINNPDYNIKFVKCKSSWKECIGGIADHGFTGTTYWEERTDKVKRLREKHGFYDSRKR